MIDPQVVILPEAGLLASAAAAVVAGHLARAVAARGEAALGLAGGSTPRRTYQLLASAQRERVEWQRVQVFFGDERCVPPDHPDSNYRMVAEALLSGVPVPAARVHRIRGEEADAAAAAAAYEAELRAALPAGPGGAPALDVLLLGVGPDGHVASLFPGDAALAERVRLAVPVLAPKPPPRRITLTLPVLRAARVVIFLVTGADKSAAVEAVLSGKGAHLPAGQVAGAEATVWMLDEAASSGA